MTEKEITIEIKNPEIIILLALLFILFIGFPPFYDILYKIPPNFVLITGELQTDLFSPIAFGDEGYHARLGQYIAEKKDYPKWVPFFSRQSDYKVGLSDLPLWWLTQGGFYLLFGLNDSIVKILVPLTASILTGLVIFIFVKRIYNKEIGLIASIIAVTAPSLVTYSVLAYKDTLFVFYFSLFLLTLILSIKKSEKKYLFLSSIFALLSLLTKTPGFVIFPIILLAFLYEFFVSKNFLKTIKKYFIFIFIFILIFGPFSIRNLILFHTPYCNLPFNLPFFDSSGCSVTSSYKDHYEFAGLAEQVGTEVDIFKMGLINYLDFAYGIIWFIPLTFFCGSFIFLRRREKNDLLVLFSIIAFLPISYLVITGRAENTARYLLGLIPLISIISANYLYSVYDFIKKYLKQLAIILFVFIVVLTFMNSNQKLYAARHYDSGSGAYIGYKIFSPDLIEACDWVKKNLNEDILIGDIVWGSATTYNCQRDVGGGGADVRLSNNLTLVLSVLKMQGVTHLFIPKFSISWNDQKLGEKYPISYVEFLESNPDHFKKIYENGPTLQQCRQMGGCDGTIIYQVIF